MVPERMEREAGWGAIKAKLKGLKATELLTLVRDLYQASPENRQFLRGRLVPTAADLEKYRITLLVCREAPWAIGGVRLSVPANADMGERQAWPDDARGTGNHPRDQPAPSTTLPREFASCCSNRRPTCMTHRTSLGGKHHDDIALSGKLIRTIGARSGAHGRARRREGGPDSHNMRTNERSDGIRPAEEPAGKGCTRRACHGAGART
jgi:hypothetical protein